MPAFDTPSKRAGFLKILAGPLLAACLIVSLWSLDGQVPPGPPQTTSLPVGAITAFAGPVERIPKEQGWLPCDGQSVSASEFPELFAAIGTGWGEGDSAGMFKLPDFRGRFLRGVSGQLADQRRDPDATSRAPSAPGGNLGNAVGSIQDDSITGHSHPLLGVALASSSDFSGEALNVKFYGTPIPDDSAQPIVSSTAVLPAGGTETRPKNAYVNWMIRAR